MTITLTQALTRRGRLELFGLKVTDFALRGDLGLGGLDHEGPFVFALIHAYSLADGPCVALPLPLIVSVHGEGVADTTEGAAGTHEARRWSVDRDDVVWLAKLERAKVEVLLGLPDTADGHA
jgi:hypothetical protein